jgi:hypothetical protein
VDFGPYSTDSALDQWKKRWLACWIGTGALFVVMGLTIGNMPWYRRLAVMVIPEALIAGWFLLLKFTQSRGAEDSPRGEEFRTGGVPRWRLLTYALIAVVGVVSGLYPDAHRAHVNMILFFSISILLPAAMIIFFASLPSLAKRHQTWIVVHPRLIRRIIYIALVFAGLYKVLSVWTKK